MNDFSSATGFAAAQTAQPEVAPAIQPDAAPVAAPVGNAGFSIFTSFEDRISTKADQNVLLVGEVGKGKTYQANTFPGEETLFVDMEAGGLSLSKGWRGTVIEIRKVAAALNVHPWALCQALACLISGPNPAVKSDDPYSQESHDKYLSMLAPFGIGPQTFDRFKYMYWDSLSVASRHAFEYYKMQPEAVSSSGAIDTRGVYGTMGTELTKFFTMIQHTQGKTTIVTAALDRDVDEFKRPVFDMSVVGGAAKKSIIQIFDHVVALANVPDEQGTEHLSFVCQSPNPLGINGLKSRGADGNFAMVEMMGAPNLYELINRLA